MPNPKALSEKYRLILYPLFEKEHYKDKHGVTRIPLTSICERTGIPKSCVLRSKRNWLKEREDLGSKTAISEPEYEDRKELQQENGNLKDEIERLQYQVESLVQQRSINLLNIDTEYVKLGVISDKHMGSNYDNVEFLHAAYKVFDDSGVQAILDAGDIADGDNYRGCHFEQRAVGFDNQLKYAVENHPYSENGIKTYYITGNHDWSRQVGADFGKALAEKRDDLVYVGKDMGVIICGSGEKTATIHLIHPGGGTAYALSYKMQKIIESYTGGTKPNILISGHFHKAEYIPNYRGVFALQAGCIEKQTPFMRSKHIAAMTGFWIIEFKIDTKGIRNMRAQFFPYYEPQKKPVYI